MADPACGDASGPDVRQALADAAAACADAVTGLAAGWGAGIARDAVRVLRALAFDEAVIEAEAHRRAAEILAAAGLVPPPRARHLHVVS